MKAKKARKRLLRIENLLGTVIDKYNTRKNGVHQLLGTAKTAVEDVLTKLPKSAKRPPAKAAKTREIETPARKSVSSAKAAPRDATAKAG